MTMESTIHWCPNHYLEVHIIYKSLVSRARLYTAVGATREEHNTHNPSGYLLLLVYKPLMYAPFLQFMLDYRADFGKCSVEVQPRSW
jgi:hypothetical protein